ncbi:hypothetical protein FISHEDRAFT_70374 [Fistulina hepatica ATCC 64428]|uniref:Uncharacterized protein n=1 Tax=Fistulina hepatica ATCC 64428 TaxID=1128425 RepID=A0A0D7AKP9_9AGAR|nr:hypothetical protein FISHEDRAFT_70374 [Fistulina hepatica ATCC 64428]
MYPTPISSHALLCGFPFYWSSSLGTSSNTLAPALTFHSSYQRPSQEQRQCRRIQISSSPGIPRPTWIERSVDATYSGCKLIAHPDQTRGPLPQLQPCVVDGANICLPRACSSALPALVGERVGTATSEARVAHEPGVADLSTPHAHGIVRDVWPGVTLPDGRPVRVRQRHNPLVRRRRVQGAMQHRHCVARDTAYRRDDGQYLSDPHKQATRSSEVGLISRAVSSAHAHDEAEKICGRPFSQHCILTTLKGSTVSSDPAQHACLPTWPTAFDPALAARSRR